MKPETVNPDRVADTLEALRQELARLSERVAALERAAGSGGLTSPAPAPPAAGEARSTLEEPASPAEPAAAAAERLSEELVLVIGAAIAAFLGKKAHIRQIRLLRTAGWAQQGRLTIQASHTLEGRTGRR
jgi:methylmalonyl-CoA carboxyltransferase large subunit